MRIADGFALSGPSTHPDPAFHAYRKDLADTALAGQVISSHYAEPLARDIVADGVLRTDPRDDAPPVVELRPGDTLLMLDCTRRWAWGYGGAERRVGYIRAEAIGI